MDWYAEYFNVDWPHADDELSAIGAAVTSQETLVDVYTLTGVTIRRRVPRIHALQGLPSGIYLVDHQKMIVK